MDLETKKCASIVLYNPDIDRLKENILALNVQVDYIFIFDNNSNNVNQINDLIKEYEKINFYFSTENKGVAFGHNYNCYLALNAGFEWILTLDQDSVILPGLLEKYVNYLNIHEVLERSKIGQLTCYIQDRNEKEINENELVQKEILWCIPSGTYVNLHLWNELGKFDELMFIDGVDIDYGITVKENNYKTIIIPFVGMLHEVGKINKVINIFGRKHPIYNHNFIRKYYIARNSIYIARKHRSVSIIKMFIKVFNRILFDFVFENDKFTKLKYALRGVRHGFKMEVK